MTGRNPAPARIVNCGFVNMDRLAGKRPVAADLDGVAIAGACDCLGQGIELPLGDALAAQEYECLDSAVGGSAFVTCLVSLSHCWYSGVFFQRS